MTQQRLAELSGLSLPFVQKLESGSTNPSVDSLSRLLKVIGLELHIQPTEVDWNKLIAFGLPLTHQGTMYKNPALGDLVKCAVHAACALSPGHEMERERTAFSAWIWAISTEFPVFFRENLGFQMLKSFIPKKPNGQHIKLRRIAIKRLAEFL